MRGPGWLGPRTPFSRLLPAWSGRRAGGGRPDGRGLGGWKERSPGRPTRLCLLCSQRRQRRGGRGGRRAQFFPPLGLRVTAAAPPDPPPRGGKAAARISELARSCGRTPRRAHPAGGSGGELRDLGREGGAEARAARTRVERPGGLDPAGRGQPEWSHWWAASVLRVGTTLARAKANSGGTACNAIGRQRRWSCSSAPPPRCRHRRCRDRPAPSPPSLGHWWGLCPVARRREEGRG